jgi:hypothetical protein
MSDREPRVIVRRECPFCHAEVRGSLWTCACGTGDASEPLMPVEVMYVEVFQEPEEPA